MLSWDKQFPICHSKLQERFASSDASGRMALERLRLQEEANKSKLTNDEENLENLEAHFLKAVPPTDARTKRNSQRLYSNSKQINNFFGDENDDSDDDSDDEAEAHTGLIGHTNKKELLGKIKQIVESGGGLEQLQFLLERATIIGINESNPIMKKAYRVCNVWIPQTVVNSHPRDFSGFDSVKGYSQILPSVYHLSLIMNLSNCNWYQRSWMRYGNSLQETSLLFLICVPSWKEKAVIYTIPNKSLDLMSNLFEYPGTIRVRIQRICNSSVLVLS